MSPGAKSGRCGGETAPLPSLRVELRFLCCPTCNLAITPPDLIENSAVHNRIILVTCIIIVVIVRRSRIQPNIRSLR
jgi:hypothetical protein